MSLCIVVSLVTAILDETEVNYSIYPNPVSQNLYVLYPANVNNIEIKIFDSLGKCIADVKSDGNPLNFDFSNFNAGVYIINITNGPNSAKLFRVIKQH